VPELIIGCGYLGRAVAATRLERQGKPLGLVKSVTSGERLQGLGIEPVIADLDTPPLPDLPLQDSQIHYFAPPPRLGATDTRVRNLIAEFDRQGHPRRIVYLSTTGVYGDCGGEWVDEQRPVQPVVLRAKRRWDAESAFRDWRASGGGELVTLRVAGIYGPGKLPLARLRKGLPLVCEQESPWTNRIHASDLVQVCIAAMERGRDGEIYNVSDGHPGTMMDYFSRIADLAGLPRPPSISLAEAETELSPGMLSYMHESRRLDSRKIRKELGVILKYPTLESGLAACFQS